MITDLSGDEKKQRAIALLAIADNAEEKIKKGDTPLEVQTFVSCARRELARRRPDVKRMGEASLAAKAYKEKVAREEGGFKF